MGCIEGYMEPKECLKEEAEKAGVCPVNEFYVVNHGESTLITAEELKELDQSSEDAMDRITEESTELDLRSEEAMGGTVDVSNSSSESQVVTQSAVDVGEN